MPVLRGKTKARNLPLSVLSGGIPDGEDVDRFLEEIYDARK